MGNRPKSDRHLEVARSFPRYWSDRSVRLAEGESSPRDGSRAFIEVELARLLASPEFVRAPMLSRLLTFLVDHRLRGGGRPPKGYVIATGALGRRADFHLASDSNPRVMAARLRILLDRYYDQIQWRHRLSVPRGRYAIIIQERAAPPAGGPDREPGATSASVARPALPRPTGQFVEVARPASPLPELPKMLAGLLASAATASPACFLFCG